MACDEKERKERKNGECCNCEMKWRGLLHRVNLRHSSYPSTLHPFTDPLLMQVKWYCWWWWTEKKTQSRERQRIHLIVLHCLLIAVEVEFKWKRGRNWKKEGKVLHSRFIVISLMKFALFGILIQDNR